MRPLLVVIIAIIVLGGVKLFTDADKKRTPAAHTYEAVRSSDNYSVEFWQTFDAGPDEFSLELRDSPSLTLQLNGNEIFSRTDPVAASESPIKIENISGVVVGLNEFLVRATPSQQDGRPKSMQLKVLRGKRVIAEQSIWSETGEVVQGTARFEVAE